MIIFQAIWVNKESIVDFVRSSATKKKKIIEIKIKFTSSFANFEIQSIY